MNNKDVDSKELRVELKNIIIQHIRVNQVSEDYSTRITSINVDYDNMINLLLKRMINGITYTITKDVERVYTKDEISLILDKVQKELVPNNDDFTTSIIMREIKKLLV